MKYVTKGIRKMKKPKVEQIDEEIEIFVEKMTQEYLTTPGFICDRFMFWAAALAAGHDVYSFPWENLLRGILNAHIEGFKYVQQLEKKGKIHE